MSAHNTGVELSIDHKQKDNVSLHMYNEMDVYVQYVAYQITYNFKVCLFHIYTVKNELKMTP